MILRRLQLSPWQPLYLSMIGFVLIPVVRQLPYDDGSGWPLVASLLAMLVGLRVIPAAVRKVVPFSAQLQAEWFNRRRTAKRYDSYQWRKLLWVGVGLGLYLIVFERPMGAAAAALALGCVICGSAGTVAWRRVTAVDSAVAELR